MGKLLLVDDNTENLASLQMAFSRTPHETRLASTGAEALAALERGGVDVVVTDLKMPKIDGMELLRRSLAQRQAPAVILLTAFGTVESAVEALQLGAFHYLTKPVNLKELRIQVDRAMEGQALKRENDRLQKEVQESFGFEGVIGESKEMEDLIHKVQLVAQSKTTALIQGESGVGKELIARAVHYNSPRRRGPFVAAHCAALAETLLESELFGHEKGAFTGAVARKIGRFEMSDGGTLFLDEIGEIPASVQVKLLRALETMEFQRVGGIEPVRVDVRVVAATNRDLAAEMARGAFREDLFYRLNVVRLDVPPLRQRACDIPVLTRHFLDKLSQEHGRPSAPSIDPRALAMLNAYSWPGNARELRNVLESILVFLEGNAILPEHLPPRISGDAGNGAKAQSVGVGLTLEEAETLLIRQTLEACKGNRTRAAEALAISRRTLQRKIKEFRLS